MPDMRPPGMCDREDCRIMDRGSTSTLMASSAYYDAKGNLPIDDPNTRTTTLECVKCRKMWNRISGAGEVSWRMLPDREPRPAGMVALTPALAAMEQALDVATQTWGGHVRFDTPSDAIVTGLVDRAGFEPATPGPSTRRSTD